MSVMEKKLTYAEKVKIQNNLVNIKVEIDKIINVKCDVYRYINEINKILNDIPKDEK